MQWEAVKVLMIGENYHRNPYGGYRENHTIVVSVATALHEIFDNIIYVTSKSLRGVLS